MLGRGPIGGTLRDKIARPVSRPIGLLEARRAANDGPAPDALDLAQAIDVPLCAHIVLAASAAGETLMSILWTILIGFIVGVVAKFIMPGNKAEPSGFILTSILGIVGAFVATYLGQSVGWYRAGESAGFLGGVVGAVVLLFVYGLIAGRPGRA